MKARVIVCLISIWVTCSCSHDSEPATTCGGNNPAESLAWLAAEVGEMSTSNMSEYLYVSKAKLGGITVFLFGNCCPNCLSVTPVYNCAGDHLGNVGDAGLGIGLLDDDELVWKAANSLCTF